MCFSHPIVYLDAFVGDVLLDDLYFLVGYHISGLYFNLDGCYFMD